MNITLFTVVCFHFDRKLKKKSSDKVIEAENKMYFPDYRKKILKNEKTKKLARIKVQRRFTRVSLSTLILSKWQETSSEKLFCPSIKFSRFIFLLTGSFLHVSPGFYHSSNRFDKLHRLETHTTIWWELDRTAYNRQNTRVLTVALCSERKIITSLLYITVPQELPPLATVRVVRVSLNGKVH